MINTDGKIWENEFPAQLAKALVDIAEEDVMRNFLRDVMTEKEIIEISSRLEAARLLSIGEKYMVIIKTTKLSSRTVARISLWLKSGSKGYSIVLNKIKTHHQHIPPALTV